MSIDWREIVAAGVCTEYEAAQLAHHIDRHGDGAWTFTDAAHIPLTLWWVVERIVLFLCRDPD